MSVYSFLRSRATVPALIVGFLGVLMVLYAWHLPPFDSSVESTNNAYVRGQVTLLSPQVSGIIAEVPVQDYAQVKKGTLLVRIDDRIYRQQLAQAQATLAAQKAALANFELTRKSKQASLDLARAKLASAEASREKAGLAVKRAAPLVERGISSKATGDDARVALHQAEAAVSEAQASITIAEQDLALTVSNRNTLVAAVEGAEAAVKLAEINVQNTRIEAPVDGRIGEMGAKVGQYVAAGSQLTAIVPDRVWVVANFKETQMAAVQPGLVATFTVDALNGERLTGHVSRISPAAGSEFSIIKPDNATGNFTKVAQRIPVRIEIDPDQPALGHLRPGMSVVVDVDTAADPVQTSAMQ